MNRKKKKYDKLVEMCIKIPCWFIIGFIVAVIILGKESYNCQQALKEPKHCLDICADQLLRFENKGLITIHCQKCTNKGGGYWAVKSTDATKLINTALEQKDVK